MQNNPLVEYARQAARRAGIDEGIFLRQITAESNWNPNAVSSAGAVGISQIMPNYHPNVNPRDPYASLDYAARLMRSHLDRYGSYDLALAAYNAGGGAVEQYGGVPPFAETQNYVAKIMSGGDGGGRPMFSPLRDDGRDRVLNGPRRQAGNEMFRNAAYGIANAGNAITSALTGGLFGENAGRIYDERGQVRPGVPRWSIAPQMPDVGGIGPLWATPEQQAGAGEAISRFLADRSPIAGRGPLSGWAPDWFSAPMGNTAAAANVPTSYQSPDARDRAAAAATGGGGGGGGLAYGYEDPRHPDHWRFVYEAILSQGKVPPFNSAESYNAWQAQAGGDDALDRAYKQAQIDAMKRAQADAAAAMEMRQRELANKAWETMMQTRSGPQDWVKYWYNSRGQTVPAGEESIPVEQALPPWARWGPPPPQQPPQQPPPTPTTATGGPTWAISGGPY